MDFPGVDVGSHFEDVAARYADIPGLPQLAKRQGADTLLQAVQTGMPLGADPTSGAAPLALSDEERDEYLARADRLYREVLETDDQSLAMTLHAVSALQGRAVAAESRGDMEQARHWYERAALRAESYYPDLARRARERAATVDLYAEAISLPAQAQLPEESQAETLEPAGPTGQVEPVGQAGPEPTARPQASPPED